MLADELLADYLPVIIFIAVAFALAVFLIALAFIVSKKNPYKDKLSAYECGFPAFAEARSKFDVRFYLIAILFIIFDIEVAFLFPWAISLGSIGMFGFWSMFVFLSVLAVGFVYEWKKGALDWE